MNIFTVNVCLWLIMIVHDKLVVMHMSSICITSVIVMSSVSYDSYDWYFFYGVYCYWYLSSVVLLLLLIL